MLVCVPKEEGAVAPEHCSQRVMLSRFVQRRNGLGVVRAQPLMLSNVFSQCVGIVRGDERSAAAMVEQRGVAAHISGDDGEAGRHGFLQGAGGGF